MRRPSRGCLQLRNRPPDPLPHKLSIEIAASEQFISAAGGDQLGIGAVLADQQVSRGRCLFRGSSWREGFIASPGVPGQVDKAQRFRAYL